MKKSIKKLSLIGIIGILLTVCVPVKATTYYSTLSVSTGGYVLGAIRNYSAGYPAIQVLIDSWTNYNNLGYTKLYAELRAGTHSSYKKVGSTSWTINNDSVGKQKYATWAYQEAGDYFYYFDTKSSTTNYGGVKSSKVTMMTM